MIRNIRNVIILPKNRTAELAEQKCNKYAQEYTVKKLASGLLMPSFF